MYLDQLAYFIEVIKCGSISAAAKNLYISQPALSQSIANLENELGTKLIKRSYSGIKPTMFGERIYNQAEGIIAQLDSALSSWKELSAGSLDFSGTAKISCTPDTSDFLSTSIMEELQHIFAVGAGAVTKLVDRSVPKIERIFMPKYPFEYLREDHRLDF